MGERFCFSNLAQRRGFSFVDRRLRNLVRLVKRQRRREASLGRIVIPRGNVYTFEEIFSDELPYLSPDDHVFNQTVSTLRNLAIDCGSKKPQSTLVGRLNAQRREELCRYCGKRTELAMFLDGVSLHASDTARLSAQFCPEHRPKDHREDWGVLYQRARRSNGLFERLVFLLKHHGVNAPSLEFLKEQGIGIPFLWAIGHRQDLIPLENSRIRQLARELADYRLTERKAWIIIGAEQGLSQSDIARRLGISRQAVSKFIATESFIKLRSIYRRYV